MKHKGILMRLMSFLLVTILGIVPPMSAIGTLPVKAAEVLGTYADSEDEVVGTWSYWDGSQDVVKTNASLLEKLPKEGTPYRYTTDNYDANNGAFDTTNWATSFMWSLNGDNAYSNAVYAIPLAFKAGVAGGVSNAIQVTAPSTQMDAVNDTFLANMPENGSLTDFIIQTPFETSEANVDAVTDWSYDIHLEKSGDPNTYLELTMLQGSIFAYFELVNANTLTITRGKDLPASVVYNEGNVIIVRCEDNMETDFDYYAFYGADGTNFNTTVNGNRISSIDVTFTGGTYLTLAYLGSRTSISDTWAENMCNAYLPYAYNFVTDTKAEYSFDEETSKVTTVYSYTFDNKTEGTIKDATIIGVLPHQYKNIKTGTQFLDYTYKTIRGTMKTIAGSSFTTELEYTGILPFMPDYSDDSEEEAVISAYLDDYTSDFENDYFVNYEGSKDTYWDGKGLNRLANAIVAARAAGDGRADSMYTALKSRLEEWFTYSGSNDTTYFYYDEGVGSMFGFPQSYSSVDQMNDHHFHYGYFIYAAAQVAFYDKNWASDSEYGKIVKELIYDIACPERNDEDSRYPYLRAFAPYEGHSWASGFSNFGDGNNQESSSEALNAWAGIILWGEATGNKELRDLGIYLYTTEVSAVENYWFDIDGDVFEPRYVYDVRNESEITSNSQKKFTTSAMVWGGKYEYNTWFGKNPLFIQGINLLPMNPTCFYLAQEDAYIKQNYELAYAYAEEGGHNTNEWFDIWCQYYAMAYPEEALAKWQAKADVEGGYGVEGGETKAHTYHFIKTFCTYGTPDTSITSNAALSSVFTKDGKKTYCAYNADDETKTVTFSDGYQIQVAPGTMAVVKEGEATDMTTYTIQYYVPDGSGSYTVHSEDTKYISKGNSVTITNPKGIAGYEFDDSAANILSVAEVADDGSTVLKVYYKAATYTIDYVLNSGTQNAGNPATYQYGDVITFLEPTREGYQFTGWYTNEILTNAITGVTASTSGNLTLYAGWKNPNEYQLDGNKKVTYEDGKIVVTVENVPSDGNIIIYYGFYNSEGDYSSIIQDLGVAGLPGANLTYNPVTGNWVYEISSGYSAGQYFVFRMNTLIDNQGQHSAWGVYQIPDGNGTTTKKAAYQVEHYKETAVDSGSYELAETENLTGAIGATVTATAKTYTGYQENTTHNARVASGTVAEDGSLVLKLYYDAVESSTGGYETPENGGYVYDKDAGTLTFYYEGASQGIVYYALFNSQAEAEAKAAEANASYPGFDALDEIAPRLEERNGRLECTISVTEGQYVVYAVNPDEKGVSSWYVGVASANQSGGENPEPTTAAYQVKYFQQNTKRDAYEEVTDKGYTETAVVGSEVTVTPTAIAGFAYNEGMSTVSGEVLADGSLVLSLYYDRNAYDIVYMNMDGATNPNAATYTYGVGLTLADATREGYTFEGWYTDEECTETSKVTAISTTEAGKVTLYAKWERATANYTVKYFQQNTKRDAYEEVTDKGYTEKAVVGTEVTVTPTAITGFTYNAEKSTVSGEVLADGSLVLSVYYDRETYSITYNNLEDGTNLNVATYTYGVGLTLANATREGYSFDGWYTDEDYAETSKVTAISTTETGAVTLYAKWTELEAGTATYEVKYFLQNTSRDAYEVMVDRGYTEIVEIGLTATVTPTEIAGFTYNVEKSTVSGVVTADNSLVLSLYYDRNAYDIVYMNIDGATNPNAATYTYGAGLTLADAEKEGYTFEGWYTDEECTEASKVTAISTTEAGKVTLYAKWERATANYTVKYFQQNTKCDAYEEVTDKGYTETAVVGTEATVTPTAITGFTYNEDMSTVSGEVLADGSLVLSLYYDRNAYDIVYMNMEGATNPNVATYIYGVGITLADATREGYTFEGWYTDEECTEASKVTAISTTEAGKVTLYAKWERATANYTVKYFQQNTSLNGYDEAAADGYTRTAEVGSTVNADAKSYTGFRQVATSVTSGEVTADGSLVLSVYYDRETYSITYNNMEGATNPNAATYTYGVGLTLADAEKEGYTFEGWYTDEECTETSKVTAISTTETGAVTLYAKWTELEASTANYTVKYFQQNTKRDAYEEVTDKGYTETAIVGSEATVTPTAVTGFTYNAEKSTVSGEVTADNSLVLSLYYDRNTYDIVYMNMDGATNAETNVDKYVYGVGLTLADATREGYTFEGWYTDEECTEASKVTAISTTEAKDVILYAKWTKNTSSDNGGTDNDGTGDGGDNDGIGTDDGGDNVKPGTNDGNDDDNEYVGPEYDFTVDIVSKEYYYTGKKMIPEIVVKDGNKVLVEKKDYTLSYKNNVKAGIATVIIKGKGNYTGTVEKQFEILPIDISIDNETVTVDDIYVAWKPGKNFKISPKMKCGTKSLKLNKDYVIDGVTSYSEVGEYTVILKGQGNYTGTREILFVVTDKTLMSKVKVSKVAKQYYNQGKEITPDVTLTYNKQPLVKDTDYTIEYLNNTTAGTATIVLTGTGENYVGVKKVTFKILGTQLKTMPISLVSTEFQYTGDEIEPAYSAGSLVEGTDFTVAYSNNKKVGKGTVIFTGIGAYSGTVKKTFKITGYDINANEKGLFEDATGELVVDYEKGGNKPAVSLKFNGNPVTEGIDYTVSYKDNKDIGAASLTVKGKGILKGTYTKDFTIKKKDIEDTVLVAQDVVYKENKKASYYVSKVTLTDVNGKTLSAGKDYDKNVTYKLVETGETFDKKSASVANLAVGTQIEVTVNGIGCYEGTTTLVYQVVPTSIKSAKAVIAPQTYTGEEVTLTEENITVKVGKTTLTSDQFEIVEGSYVNNIEKGTAKVTIRGISEEGYGGYKTVSFKIGAKGVKDIISNIFRFF